MCRSCYSRGIHFIATKLQTSAKRNPLKKLKDHILTLCDDNGGNRGTITVFIESLSEVYDDADGLGYNDDSTAAPFAGKTPYECSLLLKEMCEENSENCFDGDTFAILDERSLKDGTMLLVEEPEEEDGGEKHSVRVTFEIAELQMALWGSGKASVVDAREKAQQTDDGVLRAGMHVL